MGQNENRHTVGGVVSRSECLCLANASMNAWRCLLAGLVHHEQAAIGVLDGLSLTVCLVFCRSLAKGPWQGTHRHLMEDCDEPARRGRSDKAGHACRITPIELTTHRSRRVAGRHPLTWCRIPIVPSCGLNRGIPREPPGFHSPINFVLCPGAFRGCCTDPLLFLFVIVFARCASPKAFECSPALRYEGSHHIWIHDVHMFGGIDRAWPHSVIPTQIHKAQSGFHSR